MGTLTTVKFTTPMPSAAQVLEQLKADTGLSNIVMKSLSADELPQNTQTVYFSCEGFSSTDCLDIIQDSQTMQFIGNGVRPTYLEIMTERALYRLSGNQKRVDEYPEWTQQKWEELSVFQKWLNWSIKK